MKDVAVLPSLSVEPATPVWRKSAPAALVRAFDERDAGRFAKLIRRSSPFDVAKGLDSGPESHPFRQALWSQYAFVSTERSRALAALLESGASAKSSRKWRDRRAAQIASALGQFETAAEPDGFELVGWLALLLHETSLADEVFLRLWTTLQSRLANLVKLPPSLAGRLSADQRALLLGELPWAYGHVFALVKGARHAREKGARQLRSELSQICDEDGVPHAELLSRLPLCVAPFSRAIAAGRLAGNDWRKSGSRGRYRAFVQRTAALLQPDGRTALSNGAVHAAAPLLQFAAETAGLKPSHRVSLLAAALATQEGRKSEGKRLRNSSTPRLKRRHRPAVQSDAARVACLRNNWGVGADACTIAFDGATPRIDVTAFGVPVLSGEWEATTTVAGRAARPSGDWECVCWFSASTADYVELQRTTANGVRWLRQALLSRDDHFLLLCDIADAGDDVAAIEHTYSLPLLPGATATQDALTREWRLERGPLTLRMIPLGQSQQSVHRASGRLKIDDERITLMQQGTGSRVVCPLLFDWSPTRRRAAAQWRPLTIAENGRIVTPAEAFAARWRIGDEQWLYYHSLQPGETARTFLGHHSFHETIIGEVSATGDVSQLVEVEYDAVE